MEKEEIILNTQLALFFDTSISRPDELTQLFNKAMGGIFNQIPVVMPVPDKKELLNIPIVHMTSNNNIYSCDIARGRADFFVAGEGRQKFSDIKNDFLEKMEKYYIFFASKAKIKRVGFVTRFFIKDENQAENIAKLLNEEFRKIIHSGKIHQSFVRYVSRTEIDVFEINNYTSVEKTFATISSIGSHMCGIMITRDFNTIPEKNYKNILNKEKIKYFIEESEKKFNLEDLKKILWGERIKA